MENIKKKRNCWVFGIFLIILCFYIYFYSIRSHLESSDEGAQVLLFATAIFSAMLMCCLGAFFPGGKNSRGWQFFWTFSDFVWVLLSLFVIAKLLSPITTTIKKQNEIMFLNQKDSVRSDLIWAILFAKDRLCIPPQSDKALCDRIVADERRTMLPSFNKWMAKDMHDYYGKICMSGKCHPTIENIYSRSARVMEVYPDANKIDNDNSDGVISFTLFYSFIFIFAFSMRLGRTFAEFSRNNKEFCAYLKEKYGRFRECLNEKFGKNSGSAAAANEGKDAADEKQDKPS